MKTSRRISRGPMVGIAISSLLGIVLSVYAYYVEISKETDPSFRALCDISTSMSCSKVFTSRCDEMAQRKVEPVNETCHSCLIFNWPRFLCTIYAQSYGRGFGLVDRFLPKDSILNQPNSVFGMISYLLHGLLAFNMSNMAVWFELSTSALSLVVCIYLAAILVFVLEDFCVVCISTYVINIIISICCVLKYREIKQLREGGSKQKLANGSKKTK